MPGFAPGLGGQGIQERLQDHGAGSESDFLQDGTPIKFSGSKHAGWGCHFLTPSAGMAWVPVHGSFSVGHGINGQLKEGNSGTTLDAGCGRPKHPASREIKIAALLYFGTTFLSVGTKKFKDITRVLGLVEPFPQLFRLFPQV